jgi:hypothetical protein
MDIRKQILETYPEDVFSFVDELDGAILGVDEETMGIIYSVKKAKQILFDNTVLTEDDLSEEDKKEGKTVDDLRMESALEWFEYNTKGTKGQKWIWCEDEFEN